MNCPDIGALRTALDEPNGLDEPRLAEHLRECATCRSALERLRRSADLAGPALALLAPRRTPTAEDIAGAFRDGMPRSVPADAGAADGIEPGAGIDPPGRPEPSTPAPRWRRVPIGLRAAAVAGVVALGLGVVVATPGGREAAADFLAPFRGESLQVVTFDPNDPGLRRSLAALSGIGTVNDDALGTEPEQVDSLAEASQEVGFAVRGVDAAALPDGTHSEPAIYVKPGVDVTFTFDREKAQQFVARRGHPDVELPAKFDGASLVVSVPSATVLAYRGPDDVPKVIVGQAGELEMRTEGGVPLAQMREFLLSLPGLPADTVRQLRAISDWRTTLPVFVPAGEVDWERTEVNGTSALEFSDRGGVASALVWQRSDRIYGVGGPIDESATRTVAESLAR